MVDDHEDNVNEEPVAPAEETPAAVAEADVPEAAPAPVAEEAPAPEQKLWYVLKVQSNREKSIKESLKRRIKREALEEMFGEIVIPTEKVAETKSGQKRVVERKLFPGYIMIEMVLNDETWFLVRETTGVGDFTGAAGKPIPMQEHEIKRMLGQEVVQKEEKVAPKVKINFTTGERIKVKEGAFENFEGTIDAVDEQNGRLTVLIEVFGRSTPVELGVWEIERM